MLDYLTVDQLVSPCLTKDKTASIFSEWVAMWFRVFQVFSHIWIYCFFPFSLYSFLIIPTFNFFLPRQLLLQWVALHNLIHLFPPIASSLIHSLSYAPWKTSCFLNYQPAVILPFTLLHPILPWVLVIIINSQFDPGLEFSVLHAFAQCISSI